MHINTFLKGGDWKVKDAGIFTPKLINHCGHGKLGHVCTIMDMIVRGGEMLDE